MARVSHSSPDDDGDPRDTATTDRSTEPGMLAATCGSGGAARLIVMEL
jgi:hypothetical protein